MQNKNEFYSLIELTRKSLKDFQEKTVDYVYEQLYKKGRKKMLIADEVGLGKTIVAKGIIAKSFKNYLDNYEVLKRANPTFNVVYICSNLALANQNIRKLNFTGIESCVEDTINRLNYLALNDKEKPQIFKINSLTPGTSFDQRSSAGEAKERAIIFNLLTAYDVFDRRRNGLKWILKASSGIKSWEDNISQHYDIRQDLFRKYRDELSSITISKEKLPQTFAALNTTVTTSVWKGIQRLADYIDGRNHHKFNFQNELIRELRRVLSYLCLEYLGADIFILDEFQRYANLVKSGASDDPAVELARRVFSIRDAKVLMLSATPFKPYTNDFDEGSGEVHYAEFKQVLRFLMEGEAVAFWNEFENDRKVLFQVLRHSEKFSSLLSEGMLLKNKLQATYRKAIVRTERLLASENKNSMVKQLDAGKALKLQMEDICDFIILDKITQHLNQHHNGSLNVPIEYVKSCPYALSFLDQYQHKEKLRKVISGDTELQRILKQSTHAWLEVKRISEYLPLIPTKGNVLPNAKLRLLIEKTINGRVGNEQTDEPVNEGWKYLWIPPSLPYYELSGAYADSWGFSKSLIFSSWKMVPRMVAGLVSYEAERLTVGNKSSISDREQQDEKREYFMKRRSPRPQFTFKTSSDVPDQLNNYMLLYPSLYLSLLYQPMTNVLDRQGLKQIKKDLVSKIKTNIEEAELFTRYGKEGGDYRKWYWLAPLLLDKEFSDLSVLQSWLNTAISDTSAIDAEDEALDKEEGKGKTRHRSYIYQVLTSAVLIDVGIPTAEQFEDLCSYLADLCLASPAVCLLRSFQNHFPITEQLFSSVYNVASAFITLFNKPESIAIIRLTTGSKEYYRSAIEYCVAGNIQSMLDEYIYLLYHCDNYLNHTELSNHFSDILSLRSSFVDVDDYKSFESAAIKGEGGKKKQSLRTHYAMDFGNQKLTSAGSGRLINMRQTFNSPFRPFVLATTSIGQEGLDFHLYCRKIFHWNLPANPIDFEQREGRIHRYKGHVIRLNLAKKYREQIKFDGDRNIWELIFKSASAEKMASKVKCDLIPFWHINHGASALNIERYVPIYPFSKDIDKFKNLIKVLTYYRLTFGQPRQEDLVESLNSLGFTEEEITSLDDLMMNLSPIQFYNLINVQE